MRTLPPTIPIFAVVAIIFSAMYAGWATPTEAGALGAFVVMCIAIYRGMRWPALKSALLETAKLTVMIFALIWGVLIFVRFLGFAGLPEAFATWLVNLPLPAVVTMIFILLGYAVLGMFMDAIGMLLLTLPVGVSRGHRARLTTPSGSGSSWSRCARCASSPRRSASTATWWRRLRPDIPLGEVFRGILPFFLADAATVGLFLAFPEIVLWLPNLVNS